MESDEHKIARLEKEVALLREYLLENVPAFSDERCEQVDCNGAVVEHDIEGVPLCLACWEDLLASSDAA